MAWRYKASKYKNAVPKFPKKEESIMGVPVNDVGISNGNHIKSSCVYIAFNSDTGGGGGRLGYLPVSTKGRQDSSTPVINAHSDLVTDFDFSPFDDYLLATGSLDNHVKVWLLPDEVCPTDISTPVVSFSNHNRRIGNVLWHPTADGILAVTAEGTLSVFDVTSSDAKNVFSYAGHDDVVQSVSWKGDGSLLATSCKDKKIRVIDPRANQVVQEGQGHGNAKDSRVLWLGDKDFLLSTGFTMSRAREASIWDPRNLQSSLHRIELGNSIGTLMPLYDVDTNMTFLIGKGDCTLNYVEFTEKSPYLTAASVDQTEQIKGACLVPKRAMNLMDAEVNRVLLLCHDAINPAPYIVPRKSYREFHDDIFPDTRDGLPGMTASQWLQGDTKQPPTVRLQPDKPLLHKERRGALFKEDAASPTSSHVTSGSNPTTKIPSSQVEEKKPETQAPNINSASSDSPKPAPQFTNDVPNEGPTATPKVIKPFHKTRQSKYRYIQGKPDHPNTFITNIRNLSKSVPGESNMFAINEKRCAIPLDGAGGCLQVLEFATTARLPDTGNPVIQNGSKVTDFAWDPFDDSRLVVALDSAKINVWKIPEGGITETTCDPEFSLWGHQDKIYFISFHPLASDIIATASYDMTVRLWDLSQRKEIMTLDGHEDQVFCLGWSQNGRWCATVCKDGKIRVFEPRKSSTAIKEGKGPDGQRGARITWTVKDKYLVVSGFSKSSLQEAKLYDFENLKCLEMIEMETSPSIMVPFYDPDCSLLYFTCRGERTIRVVEVFDEEPYMTECAPFRTDSLHQAAAYLTKKVCDVRKIEIAKGYRLTSNSVEALTFTVPRVKPQYFQDDLYPDCTISWKPVMTASEWLSGKDVPANTISMCPPDMQPLSQAPAVAPKPKKFESYNVETFKTDEQKKDELLNAMVDKLEISSAPMPQDFFEGVDEDEWDD